VAVWAGAEIECFHAAALQTGEGIAVAGFPELEDPGLVALLVDPFTFPLGPFLTRLNETHERVPLVGGIAAGGRRPDASRNRRRPQRGVTRIARVEQSAGWSVAAITPSL
jgi:small ligand-binding sensory domain FIST